MNFKNHEDYMSQRNVLLENASAANEAGELEGYEAAVQEVNELDSAWEDFTQRQANINALSGAVKAPLSNAGHDAVISAVLNDSVDAERDYRMSFMNYVLHGTPIMKNQDATTVTTDVGAVIPNTILNRIVELMESNGNILAKVTRTAYKGGVTVPTSAVKPTAEWVAERATTDKKMKATGSITFSYYKLKVQVAVSIIVDNVTLEIFERTISSNIAEAMTRALEDSIINGTGVGQPKGILKETPVETITAPAATGVTYKEIVAAEAALPVAYEAGAEWVMHKKTFFNHIVGMVDQNGNPIARVDHGIDGRPEYRLLGRIVNPTEHMPITGTVGILCNLSDYMINTNMDVTVSRYTDQDTDDEVTKAIMLADGKMIDTHSLIFLALGE